MLLCLHLRLSEYNNEPRITGEIIKIKNIVMSPLAIQFGLIFLLVVNDLCTSTLLKLFQKSGYTDYTKLALTMVLYLIYPLLLVASIHYDGIGNTNLYWNVFSTVFVFILAVTMFGESVTNMQCLGILLSLIGVFMVVYKSK